MRKSRQEVEVMAMQTLRRSYDRDALNNTNVDLYIDGYMMAQREILDAPILDYLEDMLTYLRKRAEAIEERARFDNVEMTESEIEERKLIFDVISHVSACLKIHKKKDTL